MLSSEGKNLTLKAQLNKAFQAVLCNLSVVLENVE